MKKHAQIDLANSDMSTIRLCWF